MKWIKTCAVEENVQWFSSARCDLIISLKMDDWLVSVWAKLTGEKPVDILTTEIAKKSIVGGVGDSYITTHASLL